MQIKSKDLQYISIMLVTISLIITIIPEAIHDLQRMPHGTFIIAKKQTFTTSICFFIPVVHYYFYTSKNYAVEVSENDYRLYQVGDVYPWKYTFNNLVL